MSNSTPTRLTHFSTPLVTPSRIGLNGSSSQSYNVNMSSPQFTVKTSNSPPQPLQQEDGDDDEYDELEDDDATGDEDPSVFRIRSRLTPPKRVEYTTRELYTYIHQGDLDLAPPYQREIVWPKLKQIQLIDSLFHNFYIPPVVLAQVVDDEEGVVKRCVDGKQRLSSIQNFIAGLIPYHDTKHKKDWYYVSLDESKKGRRNELPQEYRDMFDRIVIQCVEYTALTPIMEREIFQRVQLGVPLSAAEKLQAIATPLADWISSLPFKHIDIENGLKGLITFETSRGRSFQNIASLVYCCDKRDKQPVPAAKTLCTWLSQPDHPSPQLQKDIDDALSDMTFLANTEHLKFGFSKVNKRVAPAEFVFIGVLLYVMKGAPDKKRAEAILNLRQTVRRHHEDIRMNTACCKTLWKFINHIDTNLQQKRPAAHASDSDSETYTPVSRTSRGRRVTKKIRS